VNEITRILDAIEAGDPRAAAELLPLVYGELRQLAARRLAVEPPGQTLQPTDLVHEAYLRLVCNADSGRKWNGRGHFFGAAAEAMRRILIDAARRKGRARHGADLKRVDLDDRTLAVNLPPDDFLVLNDAIDALSKRDAPAAEVVKLCYFGGLTVEEAAEVLAIARTTAYRHWTYARAWLYSQIKSQPSSSLE
jgi:RNA polymerase sigma factor (TIGR02999 family)